MIADIHYGKPGHFGPVIVRLCGPCKARQQQGVVKVKESWVPAIKGGSAFITLITGKNPNGEIRGQIKVPVSPSPGTAQTRHPRTTRAVRL